LIVKAQDAGFIQRNRTDRLGGSMLHRLPLGRFDAGGDSFNSLRQSYELSFRVGVTVLRFLKLGLQAANCVPLLRQF
jgi:hypothetical protein